MPRFLFSPVLICFNWRAQMDSILIVLNALGVCAQFLLLDSMRAGHWPILVVTGWIALGSVVYAYLRLGDELLCWSSWGRRAKAALGLTFALNLAWLPTLSTEFGVTSLFSLLLPGHAIMILAVALYGALQSGLTLGTALSAIVHLLVLHVIARVARQPGLVTVSAESTDN